MFREPEQWTHHHTHRVYHTSMILCWVFVLMVIVAGQLFVWLNADAEPVSISATVGEINEGPVISGGASASEPFQLIPSSPAVFPEPQVSSDFVSVVVDETQVRKEEVVVNGQTEVRHIYISQFPSFTGKTTIPGSIIFFEIHSDVVVRGSTYADAAGSWSWRSPEPVTPGPHDLYIAIQDPLEPGNFDVISFPFYIKLAEGIKPVIPDPERPITEFSGPGDQVLFDVLVKIPSQYLRVAAGESVLAAMRFINFGTPGQVADVTVEYEITDQFNNLILSNSETIAVSTQLSYLKSFFTSETLKPGLYSLTVKVPSDTFVATSNDIFEVLPSSLAGTQQTTKTPPVNKNSVAFGTLFILFGSLFVWEFSKISHLTKTLKQLQRQIH